MKLYSHAVSSSSWRVRLALELKGIDYEVEPVDVRVDEDRRGSEGFRGQSPLRQVPMLEVSESGKVRVFTQSLAIIAYLDETHPEPPLLPADPLSRAFCRECAELVNAGIQPLQNIAVQKKIRELGADPKPFVEHFVRRGLDALERRLSSRAGPFALGDRVSLVDVCLIPQLYSARRLGVSVEGLARLASIEAHCSTLSPFERAHPDAQPDRPKPS